LLATLAFVNPHREAEWVYERVPAADPRPLPRAEHPLDLDDFHAWTATTAFQVLVDGVLVHAWYADGYGPRDLFLGASATKSVLAHLVGAAGLDLDAPVEAYVPELAGTGYHGVPVRDVARMTSGVDWVEDHRDPDGPASALLAAFATGGSSRALLTRIRPGDPPGTRFAYCTADSQVLDWVRERATGVGFRAALGDLWRQLGCTEDAQVAVDGDGVALAGGGWRPPRATGPGSACHRSTVRGPTSARGRRCRSWRPAGSPRRCRRTSASATTGGPSTTWVPAWPPTAAAASSSTSTAPGARSSSRPPPGRTPTPTTTRTAAT
jgi:CubicO group peptidase (beta-lactamase class C family)